MKDNYHVKFIHRTASNKTDKRIAESYSKGAEFDVNLISSEIKVVSAHRFVLRLFSTYLDNQLHDAAFDRLITIQLLNISHEVLQNIIKLMYFREVTVPGDLSTKMVEAVKFLKIKDIKMKDYDADSDETDEMKKQIKSKHQNEQTKNQTASVPQGNLQKQFKSMQQKPPGLMNDMKNAKTETKSILPAKRKQRAMSTMVQGTSREINLPVNLQTSALPTTLRTSMDKLVSNSNLCIKVTRPTPTSKINDLQMPSNPLVVQTTNVSMSKASIVPTTIRTSMPNLISNSNLSIKVIRPSKVNDWQLPSSSSVQTTNAYPVLKKTFPTPKNSVQTPNVTLLQDVLPTPQPTPPSNLLSSIMQNPGLSIAKSGHGQGVSGDSMETDDVGQEIVYDTDEEIDKSLQS